MPKKISAPVLCFSLLIVSSFLAQISFAADVETNGNLKVNGVIESSSGGFRFPDGSTLTTVGVTGTPVAHGVVSANGDGATFSHSSNVGAVIHTLGTGVYEIVINGQLLDFHFYTTVVSMADTGPGFIKYGFTTNGHLLVNTYNTGGVGADMAFSFIIMKE